MKPFFFSFVVGCAVGLLYAALRVKSPAPPVVALLGLLGRRVLPLGCTNRSFAMEVKDLHDV
jgi:XapX domain-containing protein